MIRYRLKCKKGHEFEGWFASGAAYDRMAKRGQVECPCCSSTNVSKALMAPAVAKPAKSRKAAAKRPEPASETAEAVARPDMQRFAAHKELAEAKDSELPAEAILMQLGSAYQAAGNAEEARKTFSRIVHEHPASPYATEAGKQIQ